MNGYFHQVWTSYFWRVIVQEQQKLLYVLEWAYIWNKVQFKNKLTKKGLFGTLGKSLIRLNMYDMNSSIGCFVLPTVYFKLINAYKRNINTIVNLDTTIWREKFIHSHDKNTKN